VFCFVSRLILRRQLITHVTPFTCLLKLAVALHPFWAAGFSFARGHFVVQVPYDQYLPMVFQGEEISIGLRGFTYGYDYYTAEKSVAFHIYAIKENKERRDKVKKFWENTNFYPGSAVEGMKRLNGIIGMGDPGDTFYEVEEKEFGLGHIRTKEKFFKLYGIHTDTKTVVSHHFSATIC
jgi:[Skp1-protein]-hydroxyproline N-acetylglucosaminyltransferase